MELLTVRAKKNFRLYQLGDLHIGTAMHHSKGIHKALDAIRKDRDAKVVLVGDLCESIVIDDPRYDSDTNTQPVPFKQAEDVIELLRPISDKIITILDGNHELKIKRFVNLTAFIARALGVHYGTWTCKVTFKDMFKAFFTHGHTRRHTISSNARDPLQRKTQEKIALKNLLFAQAGDCEYQGCGHYHKLVVCPPQTELYLTDSGGKIHQKYTAHPGSDFIHPDHRWYGCSGAFYKLYELGVNSYGEIAGYRPNENGYLIIHVQNGMINNVEAVVV